MKRMVGCLGEMHLDAAIDDDVRGIVQKEERVRMGCIKSD